MLNSRKRKVLSWSIGFAMVGTYITHLLVTKLKFGVLKIDKTEWTISQRLAFLEIFDYAIIVVILGAPLFWVVGFTLLNFIVNDKQFRPLSKMKS